MMRCILIIGLALAGWLAAENAAATNIAGCSFPASGSGQTYTMAAGISCTGSQHGVILSGTNNVVDCGGHTIAGPNRVGDPDDGFGIEVSGSGHIIRNCTITGMRRGIRLHGASGVWVHDNFLTHNGDFTGHTGYGIDLDGSPAASGNRIEANRISDNADEGIHLGDNTNSNTVTHNLIWGNAPGFVGKGEAVYLKNASGNLIAWNTLGGVTNNGGATIYCKSCTSNWFWYNFSSQQPRETIQLCGFATGNSVLSNAKTSDGTFLLAGAGVVLNGCDTPSHTPTGCTAGPPTCDNTVNTVFTDIPLKYEINGGGTQGIPGIAAQDISALWWHSITTGCGAGTAYCPGDPVTRGQMAVFIERGMGQFSPPACTGMVFTDVPLGATFCDFIEEFYHDGITTGSTACAGTGLRYCPNNNVSRGEMAVFLLRGKGEFNPPPCTGTKFSDVTPLSVGQVFCNFIEQLANEHITSGCNPGLYCPNDPVNRDQMAIFIQRTFNVSIP